MKRRPRRKLPLLALFLVAAMTAGARAGQGATTPPATTAPVTASGEETESGGDYVVFTREKPRAGPRADKATLYVVRPGNIGLVMRSFFLCDQEILGIIHGSSYFFAYVDPGRHVLWSMYEHVDAHAIEVDLQAGATYYLQQHAYLGPSGGWTRLELLDEAAGKEALAKCSRHGTLTERGRAKGAEIARKYYKDTAKYLARDAEKAKEKVPADD